MILERIETNLKKIESDIDKNNFIYQFLEAYEQPKSSIKRLKDGDYNLSKKQNEVIWKKKVYFYTVKENEDVHDIIDYFSKKGYKTIYSKYKKTEKNKLVENFYNENNFQVFSKSNDLTILKYNIYESKLINNDLITVINE